MLLNTGSGGIDIFLSKVNIWNINCAWATAFIFDTRTGVLEKVSKFLRQKMSRPEGDSTPPPKSSDSCRCFIVRDMLVALKSNHYTILQYTIEYWLMFGALNIWIYPQTSVPQQRFMSIANDYSYFTITIWFLVTTQTRISPTISEIGFDLMSKW